MLVNPWQSQTSTCTSDLLRARAEAIPERAVVQADRTFPAHTDPAGIRKREVGSIGFQARKIVERYSLCSFSGMFRLGISSPPNDGGNIVAKEACKRARRCIKSLFPEVRGDVISLRVYKFSYRNDPCVG